jgi:site-specific DNA recombinase
MTRTIAYLRVSTEKQASQGVSLAAQEEKANQYAALYDLDLVDVIIDRGQSAKDLNRPGLTKALAALKNGEADALLVVKLDRLTRSTKHLGQLLDEYFSPDKGAQLISVGDEVNTRTAAGRLVLNVLMSVSQWEREAIGERTSAAMAHKKMNGEYTGGRAPYGWSVGTDGSLVAIDDEQQTIRLAKQLREEGKSLRKVGEFLSESGRLPRSGGKWHASSIKVVLKARAA